MNDPSKTLARKIRGDGRYALEAYNFILEVMEFARDELGMGREVPPCPTAHPSPDELAGSARIQKHVTGQQLCEAARLFALCQFGHMASCVFRNWGIRSTGDIGEIVFNMIDLEIMLKTPDDRREDFDDVFDLEEGLRFDFRKALRNVETAR